MSADRSEWRASEVPHHPLGDGLAGAPDGTIRREIDAELQDHLACLRDDAAIEGHTAAESEAIARERFGDPDRVARRLLLDAIRPRLLMQRATLAAAASSLALSLVAIGLLLYALGRISAVDQALARNEQAMRQVAEGLRSGPGGRTPVADGVEYQRVGIRLRMPDGEPIVGATVSLNPTESTERAGGVFSRGLTDETGRVEFPLIRVGGYRLDVDDASIAAAYDFDTSIVGSRCDCVSVGEFHVTLGEPVEAAYVLPDMNSLQSVNFESLSLPSPAVMQDIALVTPNDRSTPSEGDLQVDWKPRVAEVAWLVQFRLSQSAETVMSDQRKVCRLKVTLMPPAEWDTTQYVLLRADGTVARFDTGDSVPLGIQGERLREDEESIRFRAVRATHARLEPVDLPVLTYLRDIELRSAVPVARLDRSWFETRPDGVRIDAGDAIRDEVWLFPDQNRLREIGYRPAELGRDFTIPSGERVSFRFAWLPKPMVALSR